MSEYFTTTHEWLKIENENIATFGLTMYAQEELGDIVFIDLPEVNSHISAKKLIVVIESVKVASDIHAPVSGTIIAVNEQLHNTPDLINTSPEKEGWIARIKMDNAEELNELLDRKAYNKLVNIDGGEQN